MKSPTLYCIEINWFMSDNADALLVRLRYVCDRNGVLILNGLMTTSFRNEGLFGNSVLLDLETIRNAFTRYFGNKRKNQLFTFLLEFVEKKTLNCHE
jgi:hypothetical protein